MTPRTRALLLATAGSACLAAAPAAMADFITPDAFGWSRGAANSTHFEWDVFTSVAGPNAPDVASFPSTLPPGWEAPNVFDTSVGSFITGSGNLYNQELPLEVAGAVPSYNLGAGASTRILVQVRTLGTEIDPETVNVAGFAPVQSQELLRQPLGGFGGAIVETLYFFEIPGNAGVYTLSFDGIEGSMSLDRISIDTLAVAGGCAADWNADGAVNSNDISAFLGSWLASVGAGTLEADFNADGAVNSNDISAFLAAWLGAVQGGC